MEINAVGVFLVCLFLICSASRRDNLLPPLVLTNYSPSFSPEFVHEMWNSLVDFHLRSGLPTHIQEIFVRAYMKYLEGQHEESNEEVVSSFTEDMDVKNVTNVEDGEVCMVYEDDINVVYISPNGSDNNNGSFLFPFRTLQLGVKSITKNGGIVRMFEGIYTGVGENTNITLPRNVNVTIEGIPHAEIVCDTSFEPKQFNRWNLTLPKPNGPVLHVFSNEGSRVVLRHLKILHCYNDIDSTSYWHRGGGAVEIGGNGEVDIVNCDFEWNFSNGNGGAVNVFEGRSYFFVKNVTFLSNYACVESLECDNTLGGGSGGAISVSNYNGRTVLENVRFEKNTANIGIYGGEMKLGFC